VSLAPDVVQVRLAHGALVFHPREPWLRELAAIVGQGGGPETKRLLDLLAGMSEGGFGDLLALVLVEVTRQALEPIP